METQSGGSVSTQGSWQAKQVYLMAAVCLVVGLMVGYLLRGSSGNGLPATTSANTAPAVSKSVGQMPSLEQMKHMADKQAEPLLEQLKKKPNDPALLVQIGDVYKSTHQFKEAADYYGKSLEFNPKDVAVRTDMASCLFYSGDPDRALAQLEQSLQYDPADANTLFNLGVIKLRGKKDTKGALVAWQQLLEKNPKLDSRKKTEVQKLIAEAKMKPQQEE
jgi:cytochrome c-type biogenesis protein CcmH/NrfG